MRVLLLAAALLSAGCVVPGLSKNALPELALPEVPEGATVESIEGGLRLVFDAIDLPFEQNITIPVGTTIVRAKGIVVDDATLSVSMRHADTLRRRCNFAPLDAWDAAIVGQGVCSGVTMVDALPATWQVRAFSAETTGRVEVELLTTPIDGALAGLDTSQLSMRTFEAGATEVSRIPSFDGTELHVEVTLPEGAGPWPTIISSSPYNHADRLASGMPAMWGYFTRDWVERGYAVVNADVRGYGESDGCVGVWDVNEQRDQAFLVDWAAEQDWSDGNVGFYGQSYVGTTPVEAAVNAPAALKAIVIVAPVVDSYNDWHFGGVPNGEGFGSPVAYYQTGAAKPFPPLGSTEPTDYAGFAEDLPYFATRADNGFCDPTIALRPNDPRGVYDAFYEERNFSARAGDVTAAVLYTQGFLDSNVKSAEIPDWFNALTVPKLGLFGPWIHQHPTRADNEALFLLWFDQYVKGKPVGFEKGPAVRVTTIDGQERVADAWPPLDATPVVLPLDPAGGMLAWEPATGSATILTDSLQGQIDLPFDMLPIAAPTSLTLTSEALGEPIHFAGGQVQLAVSLEHAENAYVAAYLYEDKDDASKLITWGMFNLAHRNGHESYEPVPPGETVNVALQLLPTEHVFAQGATLRLVLRGAAVADWSLVQPGELATMEIFAEGSALELAGAPDGLPLPASAQR